MPAYTPEIPSIFSGMGGVDKLAGEKVNLLTQSPVSSAAGNPMFAQIMNLLAPGAGGMSPNLDALYNIGSERIGRQQSQDVASARTMALGRGMEGSSIEELGVKGANDTAAMARSNLLGSLLGQQQNNSSQLAEMLFRSLTMEAGFDEDRIKMLLSVLNDSSDSIGNFDLFQRMMAHGGALADRQNKAQENAAWIGAGSDMAGSFIKMLPYIV